MPRWYTFSFEIENNTPQAVRFIIQQITVYNIGIPRYFTLLLILWKLLKTCKSTYIHQTKPIPTALKIDTVLEAYDKIMLPENILLSIRKLIVSETIHNIVSHINTLYSFSLKLILWMSLKRIINSTTIRNTPRPLTIIISCIFIALNVSSNPVLCLCFHGLHHEMSLHNHIYSTIICCT